MIRDKQFRKLCANPFRTDIFQETRLIAHRFPCLSFNHKIKLRRKPHRTQDTECILIKPLRRTSNAADNPGFQVSLPAKDVDHTLLRVICHRVDREIPSFQILFKARREAYRLRSPVILIFAIHAVCGHFKRIIGVAGRYAASIVQNRAIHQNRHGSMLNSGIDGFRKDPFHFFRFCRGRDIPVVRRLAKQTVTHTSTDDIRFIAMFI